MLKKLIVLFLYVSFLASTFTASAADLSAALDSLGGAVYTANGPGRFDSAARGVYSAGGVELRMPPASNSAQLFSFTPPRVDAGCGGISAFFGGFSFISGKEFTQLLKNMASGAAAGFVSHIALKALCPYCESVVQFLQRINQAAASASRDACNWGKQMAASLVGDDWSADSLFSGLQAECAVAMPQLGKAEDTAKAQSSLCNTVDESIKKLEGFVKDIAKSSKTEDGKTDGTAIQKMAELKLGNSVWNATGVMFPDADVNPDVQVLRTWIMNLAGTSLVGSPGEISCGGQGPQQNSGLMKCPSTGEGLLSGAEFMTLLLCGATPVTVDKNSPKVHESIERYCQDSLVFTKAREMGKSARKVMICDPKSDLTECKNLLLVDIGEASVAGKKLLEGKGLLYQVNDLLTEAINRVVRNQPLYVSVSDKGAVAKDEVGQKIIALIQTAPYPLYQAINAAAVYPSAAKDIVDSMAILIGENMAYVYLDEYLRLAGRSQTGGSVDEGVVKGVLEAMSAARARAEKRSEIVAQNLITQEALNNSVRQLNRSIQQQVMSSDVLNANKFATTIGASVTSANLGSGGNAP